MHQIQSENQEKVEKKHVQINSKLRPVFKLFSEKIKIISIKKKWRK